jgi:uncharacterized protein YbjT (DUF2867 family)
LTFDLDSLNKKNKIYYSGGLATMTKSTFAIMGATGHIGHTLTELLLKKGHKIRALGRDVHKLQELKAKGAEIHAGEFTDAAWLASIFKGCQAVFSFLPPASDSPDMEVFREKSSEAIVQAISEARISHAINLSSIGANLSSGTGPIRELHHHEERLNALSFLHVLHFRPAYFMENLFGSIPTIKSDDVIASCLQADLRIPMVATQDIGVNLVPFFDSLKFTGTNIFEFVGPKELTMKETTKVIGKVIGQPDLKYVQLSYQEAHDEMISFGIKHHIAHRMVEMYKAFNEGKIKPTQKLTEDHKGKTTFEEFSKVFAQVYRTVTKAA